MKQKRKITALNVMSYYKERKAIIKLIKDTKATKTLALIVGIFIICLFPYCTTFLVLSYFDQAKVQALKLNEAVIIVDYLAYINAAINPIVYGLQMREFKDAYI